jgi:hypothetical protein
MIVHACYPSTRDTEVGRSLFQKKKKKREREREKTITPELGMKRSVIEYVPSMLETLG